MSVIFKSDGGDVLGVFFMAVSYPCPKDAKGARGARAAAIAAFDKKDLLFVGFAILFV